ncbi:MAG: DUF4087 domain-containing protein [Burkholderiales bacterium]|nr:DUF4087 domain-containing protein [Burkholderiales bacterium]
MSAPRARAAKGASRAVRRGLAVLLCATGAWAGVAQATSAAPASAPAAAASAPAPALRCGWFDNPSPGNASLTDRDGEWTIGLQGGHQARGPWPKFGAGQWVRTGHGSAGYGCACLKLLADAQTQDVLRILSARAQPLSACRQDRGLSGKEPQNPLK